MSIAETNRPPRSVMSDPDTEQATPASTDTFPYESDAFHQCWWTYLAPRFTIPVKGHCLLIQRKPILKGLFRFHEARISGWNNAWNQHLTPERVTELQELASTSGWDYFKMIFTQDHRPEAALAMLSEAGYPILEQDAPPQYWIDLLEGFEGYLNGLSHNSRKSLKKKTRKGQSLNPQLIVVDKAEAIEPFFAELFTHHIAYWDAKAGSSYFNHPEERRFIVHWAKALHESGQLVLERLEMGGETVNLSMGIRSGTDFYWLFTVNTGVHSEFVPGIIGLYLRLEQLAEQGVTRFHMGSGDYFFKIQAANRVQTCTELLVANPRSLRGKLYFQWKSRQAQNAQSAEPKATQ